LYDATKQLEKEVVLDRLCQTNPKKFVETCKDPKALDKAIIMRLIAEGHLIRSTNNTTIIFENTAIGKNIDEALAWFNDASNALTKTMLISKIN
jgi:hypothetical protein